MNVSEQNDQVRLHHMLDAALKAVQFVNDTTRESLNDDDMLAFALVRAIEITSHKDQAM